MKITMISNYINHHQIPFSNELYERLGADYCFIQTEPMEEERVKMGWGLDPSTLPYVKLYYMDKEACDEKIASCDILLVGWLLDESPVIKRMQNNRLTIRISERIYREGQYKAVSPRGLLQKHKEHIRYRKKNIYLLCAGAYVASDFHLIHAYPDKMFQFGYFPQLRHYEKGELMQKKPSLKRIEMIWAGRYLELKHPEFVIKLATDLKQQGYSFHIHMIGDGPLKEEIDRQIEQNGLQEIITQYGFCSPKEVRDRMETCHIHLFTSNSLEGWGAVVNEGMNSGLAEVVNSQVGAAPFLIRHGNNGMVYKEGSYEDFKKCVVYLLDHPDEIRRMGENACNTITEKWNAAHAAEELLRFYKNWQQDKIDPPKDGPFSIAPVIAPHKMYRFLCDREKH